MDVLVYVVLHAGITNLCSNLSFLKNYCNPNYMLSETGYYLSSLELAAEFIKCVKKEEMVDGAAKKTSNLMFVVADTRRLIKTCTKRSCPYEILKENFLLEGYDLYTCLDWLNNPCR